MKTISKTILIITVALTTAAFTSTLMKKINIETSYITWKGKKVLGSHTGTIDLKEGYLEMDGDKLTGGMFVVDMTTIAVTDLKAGEGKEKLEGHLKSDDFFGIANYQTSTLVFTTIQKNNTGYSITADLTIKEETHPITFDLVMNTGAATAALKVDRTKYGVRYGSGSFFDNLGDNTISDTFELMVTLKF